MWGGVVNMLNLSILRIGQVLDRHAASAESIAACIACAGKADHIAECNGWPLLLDIFKAQNPSVEFAFSWHGQVQQLLESKIHRSMYAVCCFHQ